MKKQNNEIEQISSIDFWTGISNSSYKLEEIPAFNPIADEYEYIRFWRTQKRRCIEGFWRSGKWMPGPLYFYVNFFHIKLQDKNSVSEILGLPWLRDIDWELFLLYEECRGFSGFADDPTYTCNRILGPEKERYKESGVFDLYMSKGLIREEDLEKTYMPAREYLRKVFIMDMGKPLYQNPAQNFISMQARGSGKSFSTAAIATHNFMFGGSVDYDYYLSKVAGGESPKSDTIVGAIDTKYSKPLIDKMIMGYENLPGKVSYLELDFPSPLYAGFSGSPRENKDFKNDLGSVVYHRTFRNNPLAGNAGRPNLWVIDEVGFFDILAESLAGVEGSQASQMQKRLVVWMLGTGGYMGGGSVNYVEHIFRNPRKYNCIAFEDEWEKRGEIGYFVPISHTNNLFKRGENLVTDVEPALKWEQGERDKRKGDRKKYAGHIINSPLVPSEVFLLTEGTVFPTVLLKDRLQDILGGKNRHVLDASYKGWMKLDKEGIPFMEVSDEAEPIRNFPIGKTRKGVEEDPKGAVELFLKPFRTEEGDVPWGRYIGGCDVVDKDASTTDSLPSLIIFDRLLNRIAAEYTGRTDSAKFFFEQSRRLAVYYNATIMYENSMIGMYTHFEQYNSLQYLADTPHQLRNPSTFKMHTNTSKGVAPGKKVNNTGIEWIANWLLEPVDNSGVILNLHTIDSPAILQELIKWNPEINADRVSALGMLFWHHETSNKVEKEEQENKISYLQSDFFARRGMLKDTNKSIERIADTAELERL